eukprot:CAMPEP_0117438382 /NCGR_PEP_ID=MMETSP0759-20121206/2024_1 /TAXON_ID=63605 /ORGANISM="Percolomonas cosmopolitus, Strain WS" /LENGTH=610 /DNA_ID=CAMNT_0005230071 /DNA_START=217 /DNA_END=2049 /DNA_ORIENTATION=+
MVSSSETENLPLTSSQLHSEIDESAVKELKAPSLKANHRPKDGNAPSRNTEDESQKNGDLPQLDVSQKSSSSADESVPNQLAKQLSALSQEQSHAQHQIQSLQQQLADSKRAHRQQIEELKMGFELRMREFFESEIAMGRWVQKDDQGSSQLVGVVKSKVKAPLKQPSSKVSQKQQKKHHTANGSSLVRSGSHTEQVPQSNDSLITRETLENLTQLIESRSEELTYLVDMLTTQETKNTSSLKQSIGKLERNLDDVRHQLKQVKNAVQEEEETVLSLATQSSSLKDCITAEIEENFSFRKKLKLTMDHYSEQFKAVHQKTTSFSTQLKMLHNQVMHMEKSKRDKLTKDEDLYQIYMEQASLYDQRFRSLRAHQTKIERKMHRISNNLHAFITNVWYQVPEEFHTDGDIRLHEIVFQTVRDFHTVHFFDIASQQQSAGPIRVVPIRPQQYRIHDRNLTIIQQNETPIVKLRDGTVSLEDYLKRLFPAQANSVDHGSPRTTAGGRSSLSSNTHHHYGSGASTPRGENSIIGSDATPRHRTPTRDAQGNSHRRHNTPHRGANNNESAPTLKVDLTSPRSLSKIVSRRGTTDGGMVKLRVNLSELGSVSHGASQ